MVLKQLAAAKLITYFFSCWRWKSSRGHWGFIYDRDHGYGSWRKLSPAQKTAGFRSVKTEVAECISSFMNEPWVSTLRVSDSAYPRICTFMRQHDLKPADLCHLTLAHAADAGLLSNDGDFGRLATSPVEIINY